MSYLPPSYPEGTKMKTCSWCKGTGARSPHNNSDDCNGCGGLGEVPDEPEPMILDPAEVTTLKELIDLLGDRWQKADGFYEAQALVKKIRGHTEGCREQLDLNFKFDRPLLEHKDNCRTECDTEGLPACDCGADEAMRAIKHEHDLNHVGMNARIQAIKDRFRKSYIDDFTRKLVYRP